MIENFNTFKINENIFGSKNKFIIIYQVTNYTANIDDDGLEEVLSENKSPIYSFIQKAKTKDEAENIFKDKWNEISAGYNPTPTLNIISVENVGNISNKIHFFKKKFEFLKSFSILE